MADKYLDGIMNRDNDDSFESESLENVPHPICPLNMYFEGDEDKCDVAKCDYGEGTRSCTEACKIHVKELQKEIDKGKVKEEKLLNDDKAILPGSGISYHQFKKPDSRILKTFDSPNTKRKFTVVFSTKELTALCPLTGMPDYYTLEISYVPNKKCIESKSAKFYFHSFRDAGMFIEALTNKIADDWDKVCMPKYLKVTNTMASRGGIPITVIVERGKKA